MTPAPLPTFIVFGEALTDFVRIGEHDWRSIAGGACWNVARVAAKLGVPTGWAGAVSEDVFGRDIVERSRSVGLDMRFVQTVTAPPLLAMVHQLDPPRYFFLGEGAADLCFDESKLPADWEQACALAHFGGISLVRPGLGERLIGIAERLHAQGVRIVFDPNYRDLMGPDYPALFERMARLASLLKVSDEDLARIYPVLDTTQALAHLRRLAPQALLMYTHGARGMNLHMPERRIDQAAFAVDVVDTVGAGDACVGGFVASWLLRPERSWPAHLRFAAATAALACTQAGAHAPTRAQVEALLADRAEA
ncbi:carbohydrate kinase [Lysobacter cavernae]|uniref:Carbohydrate kinase n=1 Tax=Lysobacter cavernae TaxID=1685901 RepID=A0ABV7RSY0_9GAMM